MTSIDLVRAAEAGRPATMFSCPCCSHRPALAELGSNLECADCGGQFPVVRGIPVLINDANSVFAIGDYASEDAYAGDGYGTSTDRSSGIRAFYHRAARYLREWQIRRRHLDAETAVARILAERPDSAVLVIGAGDSAYEEAGSFIYTDVAFSKNAACIADAHDLPFDSGSFDAVIAVAVLEHTIDPPRAVSEIWRVLKPGGYVYAATPFLQPVHMGAYDFTRYSYLGHRRLFRWFDDVESGTVLGPGAAAAYTLQYLLLSFSDARSYRRLARLLGLLLGVPLRMLDHLTHKQRSAYDGAAGVFLLGRRRETPISDRKIVTLYRGGM